LARAREPWRPGLRSRARKPASWSCVTPHIPWQLRSRLLESEQHVLHAHVWTLVLRERLKLLAWKPALSMAEVGAFAQRQLHALDEGGLQVEGRGPSNA
jgi:hypothetical protein